MNEAAIRQAWRDLSADVSARAMENKDSNAALAALAARYRTLSDEERRVIDALLAEQLGSADESVRFDAVALIREFKIVSALPALRLLADSLEEQTTPGAPYEWAAVNRVIATLADPR